MCTTLCAVLFERDLDKRARKADADADDFDPVSFCRDTWADLKRLKRSVDLLEGDPLHDEAMRDYEICKVQAMGVCDVALGDWEPEGKAH